MSPIQNAHHQLERQRSGLWDVNILDLPPRLFSDICDDLNIFNALGRDWRLLAGNVLHEILLYYLSVNKLVNNTFNITLTNLTATSACVALKKTVVSNIVFPISNDRFVL